MDREAWGGGGEKSRGAKQIPDKALRSQTCPSLPPHMLPPGPKARPRQASVLRSSPTAAGVRSQATRSLRLCTGF